MMASRINSSHAVPPHNSSKGESQGLAGGLVTLQMMLEGTGLKGGVDILAGPLGERSLELPPPEEMTPERIAALKRQTEQTHLEEGDEAEDERANSSSIDEGGAASEWDEDEWDGERLSAMGGPDPLGDVGWDVAERFEVLINELKAMPSPDIFHSIGACVVWMGMWMGGWVPCIN